MKFKYMGEEKFSLSLAANYYISQRSVYCHLLVISLN